MPEALPAKPPRRMPRPSAALAMASCLLALGAVACSSPEAREADASAAATPAPATGAEPIFASDEEALAAAVEAYEEYARVSAQVANSGGIGADAISEFVSAEFNDAVQREFAALRDSGLRMAGENVYYNPRLEERNSGRVSVIFCRDISGTRLIRADGTDATPPDRDLIQATRVEFATIEDLSGKLIVDGAERWKDEQGC
ncbi:hypothetical protein [Agromyces arachidis]|uniref:hypothetical protein n=1 Tax=Agromyces arachidis TaxID=766966 RepID=UPI004056D1DC